MNTTSIITNNTISNSDENKIIWAIIASILLHLLFAVVIPNFKFDNVKKEPQVLKIELHNPVPPAPPVIEPEQPKPVPKKVTPKKRKPKIKPVIAPIVKPIEPLTPEEPTPTPPVVEKVIDVTPQPVKAQPPKPKQIDIEDALRQYSSLLGRNIAQYKSYPKIAIKRGWQGKVILDLKIDGNGNVLSAKVRESSGHSSLDKEALKMVKKAAPFPKPPLALQSQNFNITVPVSFKLDNG